MLQDALKKDHVRLIVLLNNVIKNKSEESLVIFLSNVRRHIEIENEIIYGKYGQGELKEVGLRILADHKNFVYVLNEVESTGVNDLGLDKIKKFRENFAIHNLFEDENFYPVIEGMLGKDEIADILFKVRNEVMFNQ
jgi:hemerythrin-like domain-containing protein